VCFSRKRQDGSAPIFFFYFSWFRRKHLFITTCIEKQCTRPLKFVFWLEIFKTSVQGRRHRGDWGEQSPSLLTKVFFVNPLKPMRKYWGYDVTSHIWISVRVCHKWFLKTGSNLYFIKLLSNFILLNLFFFVIWNSCAMPFGLCVIKFARLLL